eukprot:290381_1
MTNPIDNTKINSSTMKDNVIKANTEILVDGFLRECLRETDPDLVDFTLPTDLNRLCIKFIYIKLKGIGQTIMYKIFNGTLSEYIFSNQLKQAFNCSSESKAQIAEHCIKNEIIAPLKVIVDYVYSGGMDNDCIIPLTAMAIRYRSYGSLSVLLRKANNDNSIKRAALYLCSAVEHQSGNEKLMIYIMKRIGMYDNALICYDIGLALIEMNMRGTLRIIVNQYYNHLPKRHINSMGSLLSSNEKSKSEVVFANDEYNDWNDTDRSEDDLEWAQSHDH